MSLISIENFTKTYGKYTAVSEFSLSVDKGELVALVGPDGAGKTTLFRSLCGLLEFDRGELIIDGFNIKEKFDEIKPLLGYMPQNFSLYPDLSVEENLRFYGGLFGLEKDEYNQKKERLYRFSGLGPYVDRRAGNLSGGMKQKLALSCNLIHDPEILILDEPTTGVDPVSRRQFWDILKSLKQNGSTILVSTPYMDEVALSDRAVFIHKGKKLIEGKPDKLTESFVGSIYNVQKSADAEMMKKLDNINGLTARRFGASLHIYLEEGNPISNYYDRLAEIGIEHSQIRLIEPELEDLFIQLMERTDA